MRSRLILLLLIGGLALGCASLSVKEKATNTYLSVHYSLLAIDDIERLLCQPDPVAVNHCTAVPAILTDAAHQRTQGLLAGAYAVDVRIATALQAWVPGTPIPTDLTTLRLYLLQVQAIAESLTNNAQVTAYLQVIMDTLLTIDVILRQSGMAPTFPGSAQ